MRPFLSNFFNHLFHSINNKVIVGGSRLRALLLHRKLPMAAAWSLGRLECRPGLAKAVVPWTWKRDCAKNEMILCRNNICRQSLMYGNIFSLVFEKRGENNERSVLSKCGRIKVFVSVIVVLVCIATRRRTAVVSVQKLGTTGD